jgi:bifunctional non-homologous end joining protein LigD
MERLRPVFTDKAALWNPPKIPERLQWVQPKLVCEVAFAEWTHDGELRRTAFLGWTDDKSSEQVVLE